MSTPHDDIPYLIPLGATACRLRVTAAWLKAEVEAGRIPCLRAGKRLLFHEPTVARILAARARRRRKAVRS
jgi:hypothetical protein